MGCICHKVVCLSCSFVDVRARLKSHIIISELLILVGNAILYMVHLVCMTCCMTCLYDL